MATNKRILYVGGLAEEVNEKVMQASEYIGGHYVEWWSFLFSCYHSECILRVLICILRCSLNNIAIIRSYLIS